MFQHFIQELLQVEKRSTFFDTLYSKRFTDLSIYFGCPKETTHCSFGRPQYIFWLRNKDINKKIHVPCKCELNTFHFMTSMQNIRIK